MAKAQIDRLLTALAGEYLVAGFLSLKGYVPLLTFRNYPDVDIFYLNPKNGENAAVQVKTIRDGDKYFIPEKVDKTEHPFVFVQIKSDESVEFYILPAEEVASRSAQAREEYKKEHPKASGELPRMLSIRRMASFKNRCDLMALD